MSWQTLVAVSRTLASTNTTAPIDQQTANEHCRKAVSAAYYAMFHALSESNADAMASDPRLQASRGWHLAYRALEHRTAYRQLADTQLTRFSAPIRDFGSSFRYLQERRHSADYDPQSRFSTNEANNLIEQAQDAITQLFRVQSAERYELANHILFRERT